MKKCIVEFGYSAIGVRTLDEYTTIWNILSYAMSKSYVFYVRTVYRATFELGRNKRVSVKYYAYEKEKDAQAVDNQISSLKVQNKTPIRSR